MLVPMELAEQINYYYNLFDDATDRWEIAKSHDVEYQKTLMNPAWLLSNFQYKQSSDVAEVHFLIKSKFINTHIKQILNNIRNNRSEIMNNDSEDDSYCAEFITQYNGVDVVVSFNSENKFDKTTGKFTNNVDIIFMLG
jgi:hypothetical protein